MFERFTDAARRTVVAAQDEARQLRHPQIGCVHFLIALFHARAESDDVVLMRGLPDVKPTAAREIVAGIAGTGTAEAPAHLPIAPNAQAALEASMREALGSGSNYIGPGHLLLAFLDADDAELTEVLANLSVDAEAARAALVELPRSHPPAEAGAHERHLRARVDTLEEQVARLVNEVRALRDRLDGTGG